MNRNEVEILLFEYYFKPLFILLWNCSWIFMFIDALACDYRAGWNHAFAKKSKKKIKKGGGRWRVDNMVILSELCYEIYKINVNNKNYKFLKYIKLIACRFF